MDRGIRGEPRERRELRSELGIRLAECPWCGGLQAEFRVVACHGFEYGGDIAIAAGFGDAVSGGDAFQRIVACVGENTASARAVERQRDEVGGDDAGKQQADQLAYQAAGQEPAEFHARSRRTSADSR